MQIFQKLLLEELFRKFHLRRVFPEPS